jgi:hypothetical protein
MENKVVRFKLVKISTDQFALIESVYKKDIDSALNISLQFGANSEMKLISVKASFKFEQISIPFLIIETTCFFSIDSSDWNDFLRGEEIIVPKGIMTHFTMLTVGTTRGILHAKTEGTNFNGFIIQPVNLAELITQDIKI